MLCIDGKRWQSFFKATGYQIRGRLLNAWITMKSLFSAEDNQEIIDRINRLTPQTPARWGKMNVSQMITHCQQPLKVAYGELKEKQSFTGRLFGGLAKNNCWVISQCKRTCRRPALSYSPMPGNLTRRRNGSLNWLRSFIPLALQY